MHGGQTSAVAGCERKDQKGEAMLSSVPLVERGKVVVIVTVAHDLPPIPMTESALFTERIALVGAFPAGTCSLCVNDYVTSFGVM
jgi:hypothetical protein